MALYDAWSEALEKELSDPFPEDWVQVKTLKGNRISFVPWHRYAERLNELVGPQGWAIPEPRMQTLGSRTVLFVGLTVHGVTKWDVGEEHHEVTDKQTGEVEEFNGYGGPVLNAYAQALKRSAAKFGMGLYLYNKSAPKGRSNPPRQQPRREPRQPKPKPAQKPQGDGKMTTAQAEAIERLLKVHDAPSDLHTLITTTLAQGDPTFDAAAQFITDIQKHPKKETAA